MKVGTIIRMSDGREGTVVYHGLDGDGIIWGRVVLSEDDIKAITEGSGGLFDAPENFPDELKAEAMLRESYPWAEQTGMECVGSDYEIAP